MPFACHVPESAPAHPEASQAASSRTLVRSLTVGTVLLGLTVPEALGAAQGYGPQLAVSGSAELVLQVAGGDMNGDGHVDLLVTDNMGTEVLVMDGMGNGEFGLPRPLGIPARRAIGIAALDADGDGDLEVILVSDSITTQFDPRGLLTYSRDASGDFQLVSQTQMAGAGDERVEPVDLDGDGDLDLLLQQSTGSAGIPTFAMNDGAGNFSVTGPQGMIGGGLHGAAGDIDGDGMLDIIMRDGSAGLAWWPHLGGGAFGAAVPFGDPAFDPNVIDIEAGDLDGDGDVDVVVSASDVSGLGIFRNVNGVLSFERILSPALPRAFDLQLGDFDGDADLDILAVARTIQEIQPILFRNEGGLFFSGPDAFLGTEEVGGLNFSAFDATGDGRLDIFMAGINGPIVSVLSAPPVNGGYALEPSSRPLTGRLQLLRDVATVDFDGDGDLDVISSNRSVDLPLAFHENVGADRFRLQIPLAGAPSDTRLVDAGDVDGDGNVDLVTSSSTGDLLWVKGLGGGVMQSTIIGSVGPSVNAGPHLVDLDGDGDLDVVIGRTNPNEIIVYDQLNPGVFDLPRLIDLAPDAVQSLVAEDLNGDGIVDLAALMGPIDAQSLRWYRGVGNGFFASEGEIAGPIGRARSLHAVDLDGSDTLDLVWVSYFAQRVFCAQGMTGGAFAAPITLGTVDGLGLRMGIMESGPRKDIVVGVLATVNGSLGSSLAVLPSLGGLNYGPAETLTYAVREPIALGFEDLDADGDLDILSVSQNDERVAWHRSLRSVPLGSTVCDPAVPNSSGRSGRMVAYGSAVAADANLILRVQDVTPNAGTLFLVGSQEGLLPGAGGSEGNLCLAGTLGRFQRPGELDRTNPDGTRSIAVQTESLPQPSGFVPILAGQTWTFQAWHRDVVQGMATSNFTGAVTVSFL